jgi:hypothetical protein
VDLYADINFNPEGGDSIFLRNGSVYRQVHNPEDEHAVFTATITFDVVQSLRAIVEQSSYITK